MASPGSAAAAAAAPVAVASLTLVPMRDVATAVAEDDSARAAAAMETSLDQETALPPWLRAELVSLFARSRRLDAAFDLLDETVDVARDRQQQQRRQRRVLGAPSSSSSAAAPQRGAAASPPAEALLSKREVCNIMQS